MSDTFPWSCPYCNRDATISASNFSSDRHRFNHQNKDGDLGLHTLVVTCPNPKCKEYVVTANLTKLSYKAGEWHRGAHLLSWKLRPQSQAKPYPDYVPEVIQADYEEACLIKDLSPKASATLSRRCLQGMIRDFWKIRKKRLIDEINALQPKIDPLTWKAVDAVRKVGNIGAHMEKDINIIIDVDPGEADMLIGLIELLIKDWYVTRHEREQQLSEIVEMSAKKKPKQSNNQIQPTAEGGG